MATPGSVGWDSPLFRWQPLVRWFYADHSGLRRSTSLVARSMLHSGHYLMRSWSSISCAIADFRTGGSLVKLRQMNALYSNFLMNLWQYSLYWYPIPPARIAIQAGCWLTVAFLIFQQRSEITWPSSNGYLTRLQSGGQYVNEPDWVVAFAIAF